MNQTSRLCVEPPMNKTNKWTKPQGSVWSHPWTKPTMNQTSRLCVEPPNLKALCGATHEPNQQMNQTSRLCVEPPNLKAATHEPNQRLCANSRLCVEPQISRLCVEVESCGENVRTYRWLKHTHTLTTHDGDSCSSQLCGCACEVVENCKALANTQHIMHGNDVS